MELKRTAQYARRPHTLPFNQTRMELKPGIAIVPLTATLSFNQTRMELKLLKPGHIGYL